LYQDPLRPFLGPLLVVVSVGAAVISVLKRFVCGNRYEFSNCQV
jgi:hypothetical protein